MKIPDFDISGVRVPENVPPVFYAAVFLFFLAVFLFAGFPGDSVERRIISEIRSRSPVPVFVGEARLRGISSVELKNVGVEVAPGRTAEIEKARIRAGIFSLLFSDVAGISFSLDAYGGRIRGKVSHDLERNAVAGAEVNLTSVEAAGISRLFLADGGISVKGKIDGNIRLSGEETTPGSPGWTTNFPPIPFPSESARYGG